MDKDEITAEGAPADRGEVRMALADSFNERPPGSGANRHPPEVHPSDFLVKKTKRRAESTGVRRPFD